MRLAQLQYNVEDFPLEHAELCGLPGVQQLPDRLRQEAVCVQIVLFDVERRIVPFEIARAIADHAMAEDEILGASRRADRVGLDETEPFDGGWEGRGREERPGDCLLAQLRRDQSRMGHRYSVTTFSPRSYRARSLGSKIRTTRSISYLGGQSSLPMSLSFANRPRNAGSSHDSTRM